VCICARGLLYNPEYKTSAFWGGGGIAAQKSRRSLVSEVLTSFPSNTLFPSKQSLIKHAIWRCSICITFWVYVSACLTIFITVEPLIMDTAGEFKFCPL
jgi:hypothetical protein